MILSHVSAAQLELFERCGEQYRRRYMLGEKIPPGVAAHRGTAVHVAAQANNVHKRDHGSDLTMADVVALASTAFDGAVAERGYMLTPSEQAQGARIVLGNAKDRAVKLASLYRDTVAPKILPVLVEEEIRLRLPVGPEEPACDLVGRLDLSTVGDVVRDLKTRKSPDSQRTADTSLQLTIYALGFHARMGRAPAKLVLDELIDTATPKYHPVETTRSAQHYTSLIARIRALRLAIATGTFAPAAPDSWVCCAKWCGFARTCPYWSGREE